MKTMIEDFSIKGLSMRIMKEIQKDDWNYRYLVEHFLVMGLRLASMTEDYKEVVGLAKKGGYLLCGQYEADPTEWADLAGEIGEIEEVISKIHDDNISVATSEVERQIKAQLYSTVEYLHEEIPK